MKFQSSLHHEFDMYLPGIQFTSKNVFLGSEWGIDCFDEGCNQTQLDADIRGKMKKIYTLYFLGVYKCILDQRETLDLQKFQSFAFL